MRYITAKMVMKIYRREGRFEKKKERQKPKFVDFSALKKAIDQDKQNISQRRRDYIPTRISSPTIMKTDIILNVNLWMTLLSKHCNK